MFVAGPPAPGFSCFSSFASRYTAVLPALLAAKIILAENPSLTLWQDKMSTEQIDALVQNFQQKGYVRELADLFWDTQMQRA